ncbi:MAG: PEP-CTERM sorting domain-containing protein [Bryobacterales bacterium]|nr:PEP-CTERM sorting domain-containing protein [Bryobacterales bacterium]
MRLSALILSLLAFVPASAWCGTVDFTTLPVQTTSQLILPGLTITGSGTIWVGSGLGVVGGDEDYLVDGAEWIEFTFTGAPATGVSYWVGQARNLDGDIQVGERFIEAFDAVANSLGTAVQFGAGSYPVSSLFNNVPLSRFRLTADVDGALISSLTYDMSTVPEPSSLGFAALGGLGLALFRRRRPAGLRR